MDDTRCSQFFAQPQDMMHRRYEALRAYFVEHRPLAAIADQFGYRLSALKSMVCRFRAACNNGGPPPFFFRTDADALAVAAPVPIRTDPSEPMSRTADS